MLLRSPNPMRGDRGQTKANRALYRSTHRPSRTHQWTSRGMLEDMAVRKSSQTTIRKELRSKSPGAGLAVGSPVSIASQPPRLVDALDAVLATNRVFCRWRRLHSRSEIGGVHIGSLGTIGEWRSDGHRHAFFECIQGDECHEDLVCPGGAYWPRRRSIRKRASKPARLRPVFAADLHRLGTSGATVGSSLPISVS